MRPALTGLLILFALVWLSSTMSTPTAQPEQIHFTEVTLPPPAFNRGPDPAGITIEWPAEQHDRAATRAMLHQCRGVRLAQLDASDQISFIEADDRGLFSPIARSYTDLGIQADHAVTGRRVTGHWVRLHPLQADQQFFAAIETLAGPHDWQTAAFSGQYEVRKDGLYIGSMRLNGKAITGEIQITARCT